jgi:hypothetical protein
VRGRAARLWPVARAVAARPRLWPTAAAQAARLAPSGWWRRWPPLPTPDRAYLEFRVRTAYGDAHRPVEAADVVAWLEWCRAQGARLRAG